MRLLLSMGLRPHGAGPLRPRLRILETATGAVHDALVPDLPPSAEHEEFTGAHLERRPDGDRLWQCTRRAVWCLSWPDLRVVQALTHPLLHDVHHALPTPEGIWVACTGHDSVLRFHDGALDAHAWLHPEGTRWDPGPAFRAAHDGLGDFTGVPYDRFKPHPVHPNHLFLRDGAVWVTALNTERAVPLDGDPADGWPLPGPAHDGTALDGLHAFTSVDGHLHLRAPDGAVVDDLDLAGLEGARGHFGWCRGVARVGETAFVGVSMLRATRWREAARRLLRGPKAPTRVLQVDLATRRVVGAWPVGNPGGTIYALHVLPR